MARTPGQVFGKKRTNTYDVYITSGTSVMAITTGKKIIGNLKDANDVLYPLNGAGTITYTHNWGDTGWSVDLTEFTDAPGLPAAAVAPLYVPGLKLQLVPSPGMHAISTVDLNGTPVESTPYPHGKGDHCPMKGRVVGYVVNVVEIANPDLCDLPTLYPFVSATFCTTPTNGPSKPQPATPANCSLDEMTAYWQGGIDTYCSGT